MQNDYKDRYQNTYSFFKNPLICPFVLRICLPLQNLPKSSPLNIVLMRLIENLFIFLFFASFWSLFGSLVLLFWSVVAELGFLILLVLFFFFYVSVPLRFAFGFGNLCGFLFFFSGLGVYSVYARLGAMCNTARMLLRSWNSHRSQRANSCMASSRVRRRRGVVVWRRCFADEVGSNTGQCVAAQRSAS